MAGSSAWPVKADGPTDLPDGLGVELAGQLAEDETLERLMYVPADPSRSNPWPATRRTQVMGLTNRRLITGAGVVPGRSDWTSLPYDAVLLWGIEECLLYGRLDVFAEADGRLLQAHFEFNTVGLSLVTQALEPLQRAVLAGQASAGSMAVGVPPELPVLGMKFSGILRRELLPGESLRGVVFQDVAQCRGWHLWRGALRSALVVARTSLRLIVIREEGAKGARYGYAVFSIPSRCAPDSVLHETDGRLMIQRGRLTATLELADHRFAGRSARRAGGT